MPTRTLLLKILVILSFAAEWASANPPVPEAGFLQVVNLVSLKEPTTMAVGDFALHRGEAILPGDGSGILALKPNDYTIKVSNPGATPQSISIPVTVVNGGNLVVICYDSVREKRDGTTESKLNSTVLSKTVLGDLPKMSLVSLVKSPVIEVSIGGDPIFLPTQKAHQVPVSIDDSFSIKVANRSVGTIDIEKKIHYIGFIFTDPETGRASLSVVQNEKLEYQPPLADDEEG